MEILCKARKWGNSVGIVLPNELVVKERIKEGEELIVIVKKKGIDLSNLFGSLSGLKIDAQKMKDESRKIWDIR